MYFKNNNTANSVKTRESVNHVNDRFSFVLYCNNDIVCQRNFEIKRFVEGSMDTIEFKDTVDDIMNKIKEQLNSQTRVYMAYNYSGCRPVCPFNPDEKYAGLGDYQNPDIKSNGGWYDDTEIFDSSLNLPLQKEWTDVLKFVVYDNIDPKHPKEKISQILDLSCYPKDVRYIDITKRRNEFYEDDVECQKLYNENYIKLRLYKNNTNMVRDIIEMMYPVCSISWNKDNKKDMIDMVNRKYMGYELNIEKANRKYLASIE